MLFWTSIGITMLFYSFSRLVFLIWNWKTFQSIPVADLLSAFVYGLRFDLWAVVVLAVIPWLLSFILGFWRPTLKNGSYKILFCLFQLPFFICTIGDSEYIHFSGRRLTAQAFVIMKEMQGKTGAILWSYAGFSLFVFLLVLLLIFLVVRLRPQRFSHKAWFVVSILAVFLALRGGWQKKPLNFAHAQVFTQPAANNLVMNSTFSILQTLTRQPLAKIQYFSQEEMLPLLNANFSGESLLKQRPPQPSNVVLVVLESFSLEHMGYPHGDKGFTPFLDELAQKGLFFKNNFANSRRSIEGIAAIMGGVPALMEEPFISSPFLTNYFLGVGTLLAQKGYHTSFFHGAANGSMYFDQFMKSAGVQNYFGQNEYPRPEDSDGLWGIYDEPFLQWWLSKLNGFPQPFFSTVFTLSSHHPYKLPDSYKDKFPEGPSEIHRSIAYTDFALREFFEKAAQQPWYNKTLFILTADHTFKSWRPEYDNELGRFKTPLVFFYPGFQWPAVNKQQVTSQIDILPSILDFLNLPQMEENKLGRSVFRQGDRNVILMLDHKYWLVKQDHFLTFEKPDKLQLYSFSDPAETKALQNQPLQKQLEFETKAAIQYFSQGMWDNRLYYPAK